MDALDIGRRVAQARDVADVAQEGLGRAVGLDRTAIRQLENGERKLNVTELAAIAQVLGRSLSFFVDPPVPAVVSRRAETGLQHSTSRALEIELAQFAGDVRTLLDLGLITAVARTRERGTPDDQTRTEQMAKAIRSSLGMDLGVGYEAVQDLGRSCGRLGLYTYSAPLGEAGPDGACVEVTGEDVDVGAAVINGDAPAGQRRLTLAHQLGHWLCEDPYGSSAFPENENMIHSFAIHFLAPRAGLHIIWSEHDNWCDRDRALAVAATYKLSWSATLGQLKNVGIIDSDNFGTLSESEPRLGDYLRLGLSWSDELTSPYLSPGFVSACVNGYADEKLTKSRSLELLRGTVTAQDLPPKHARSIDHVRAAFTGHRWLINRQGPRAEFNTPGPVDRSPKEQRVTRPYVVVQFSTMAPSARYGGAERVVGSFAAQLEQAGFTVHSCGLKPRGGEGPEHPIHNIYWPFEAQRRGPAQRALWHAIDAFVVASRRTVKKVVDELRPDVVITHNLRGWGFAPWVVAAELGLPLVHVVHDYSLICNSSTLWRGAVCAGVCTACRPRVAMARRRWPGGDVVGVSSAVLSEHQRRGLQDFDKGVVIYPTAAPGDGGPHPDRSRPVCRKRLATWGG